MITKIPYTTTMISLVVLNVILLVIYRKKIEWYKYRNTFLFTLIWGVNQIHAMQNGDYIRAWYFPENNWLESLGFKMVYHNVDFQDVIFVIVFFSIFYILMHAIKSIPDVISSTWFKIIIILLLIVESRVYEFGGLSSRILIVSYIILPILILLILNFDFTRINKTHALLSFCFVVPVACTYDFIGVFFGHWVYNTDCSLFGKFGWFGSDRWHISTFLQYGISGWFVMYFSYIYFNKGLPK
jgi:hypothetical protein